MANDNSVTYECWLTGDRDSFKRLTSTVEITQWLAELLDNEKVPLHTEVHIVPHLTSEYGGWR